jgi:hypothetical protein
MRGPHRAGRGTEPHGCTMREQVPGERRHPRPDRPTGPLCVDVAPAIPLSGADRSFRGACDGTLIRYGGQDRVTA